MKLLKWLFALSLVIGAAQIGLASASDASTNCSVSLMSGGLTWRQYCTYNTNYSGANFSGTSSWNYADSKVGASQGVISGHVTDTAADGACAIAKIGWEPDSNGPITWIQLAKACGKSNIAYLGNTGTITLNQGSQAVENVKSGIYLFDLCSPASDCTHLWVMDVLMPHLH